VNFASDNNAGVIPEVIAAISSEAEHFDAAYGWDAASQRMNESFAEIFERAVDVYCVPTGTAANALGLAALNPMWGAVICHEHAHIVTDECAAPTVIGNGLTLLGLPGEHGKLTPAGIAAHLAARRDTGVHSVPATGISLTQATEAGTRYGPDEVGALSEFAHDRDMTVHMDGARFANAVAGAGSTPAELTWRAGVDAMSFGATKGGALAAEAVVVFSERTRDDIERLRKRTGHLLSKQRFAAAQFVAWLADDTWLRLADHANQLAVRLADGLTRAGIRISHPVEANITHAWFGPATMAAAGAVGAEFYQDSPVTASDGTLEVRLVTSWSTTPEDVDTLVAAVSSVADRQSD
jgi:threonine aldolase